MTDVNLTEVEIGVLQDLWRLSTFPDHYLVLDLETCGFSPTHDFIVDAGWAIVQNGVVIHSDNLLLDWSQLPGVDTQYIQRQLRRLEQDYRAQGRPFYYPWERLTSHGTNPLEALYAYATLIYENITRGEPIVGHGFWRFDRTMIDGHLQRFFSGYELPWQADSILDTGLIEKAIQVGRTIQPDESLDDWFAAVDRMRMKGVKWNLESHAAPKYQLAETYNLDMSLMHTAAFDCVLIHYLLKTYQQLSSDLYGKTEE